MHASDEPSLLTAADLAGRFSLLSLARSLAAGVLHGRHRSLSRGGSAEFFDFRAYAPGDPLRMVDWRLYGRTDRAYLRRYRQESQINLILAVDASASMQFAGIDPGSLRVGAITKLRRACELAAAMAIIAVRGGDRVGLVVAGGSARDTIAPASGGSAARAVIGVLERVLNTEECAALRPTESSRVSALADAFTQAEAMTRRGGVIVGFSDALDEAAPILHAASRLRRGGMHGMASPAHTRCDVALVQVLTDDEVTIPALGGARLIDPESSVSADFDDDVIDAHHQAVAGHIKSLRRGFTALGGRHVLARTSRPAIEALHDLLLA